MPEIPDESENLGTPHRGIEGSALSAYSRALERKEMTRKGRKACFGAENWHWTFAP
jgi:hypothetical protein